MPLTDVSLVARSAAGAIKTAGDAGIGGSIGEVTGAFRAVKPNTKGLLGLGGTGLTGQGVSTAIGDIAGVFGAFQQAEGYRDEANLYDVGAVDARRQADLAGDVEDLQAFQLRRKVLLTESAQRAAAATNGLGEGGSAAVLLRESQMQGNEASGNLLFNSVQKTAQFQEQASAADMQARAARSAASGSVAGGLLKGVGAIAAIAGML